jgi:TonB family protein
MTTLMSMLTSALLLSLIGAGQVQGQASAPVCGAQVAAGTAAAEFCLGEDQLRAAEVLPAASPQRARGLEAAAEHFRRAASLATSGNTGVLALEALATLYDPRHLAQPRQVENALRELIAQQPNDLHPVFRLAKLLEDEGLTEAAEDTLLAARRQQPDAAEPYRMLAQYYARRATALNRQAQQQTPAPAPGNPGERDENGVYRVGGPIPPPSRLDVARYPPEAAAAGIQGNVQAEIVVNEAGLVSEARVVRSVPMLDEAALEAVRNWRFEPAMVDGRAVPVRMVVTVNFTTR